jgi:hypothetical protein
LSTGQVVERFWGFSILAGSRGTRLSEAILKEVDESLQNCREKLVAQSYGGVSVMSREPVVSRPS